jgi:hypothetical protein
MVKKIVPLARKGLASYEAEAKLRQLFIEEHAGDADTDTKYDNMRTTPHLFSFGRTEMDTLDIEWANHNAEEHVVENKRILSGGVIILGVVLVVKQAGGTLSGELAFQLLFVIMLLGCGIGIPHTRYGIPRKQLNLWVAMVVVGMQITFAALYFNTIEQGIPKPNRIILAAVSAHIQNSHPFPSATCSECEEHVGISVFAVTLWLAWLIAIFPLAAAAATSMPFQLSTATSVTSIVIYCSWSVWLGVFSIQICAPMLLVSWPFV